MHIYFFLAKKETENWKGLILVEKAVAITSFNLW